LQETELLDKTITWGATGQRAWGQNVLRGSRSAPRPSVGGRADNHSPPGLSPARARYQHERAINLNPDNKTATAHTLVKLHKAMHRAPAMRRLSLLKHKVQPLLFEDEAFHKFNKMSSIDPWIDRQDKVQCDYVTALYLTPCLDYVTASCDCLLCDYVTACYLTPCLASRSTRQCDYVTGARFKGARNLQNRDLGGAATKGTLIKRHAHQEGHRVNEQGVRCIPCLLLLTMYFI